MEYSEYSIALETYNNLYNKTELDLLLTSLLSYSFAIIILSFIFPLFTRYKESLSMKIFKVARLNDEHKSTFLVYFMNGLNSFLHNSITLLFSLFLFGGTNLLNIHFLEIGIFTFNILHVILLSIIINIVSLICLCTKKKKGLFSRITKTNYYLLVEQKYFNEESKNDDEIL